MYIMRDPSSSSSWNFSLASIRCSIIIYVLSLQTGSISSFVTNTAKLSPSYHNSCSTSRTKTALGFALRNTGKRSNKVGNDLNLQRNCAALAQFASSNSNTNDRKPYQVCILGGGFGGVNAALTLASLGSPPERELQITMIDPKERFVFLPLLYELCVGDATLDEVAPTYQSLFSSSHEPTANKRDDTTTPTNTMLQFKQGTVIGVDVKNSCVFYNATSTTALSTSIEKINYDALVVCTGLDATPSSSIPGAQHFARTFYTLDDCYTLRKQLNLFASSSSNSGDTDENSSISAAATRDKQHIMVVGAGYSGVELSLNVMDFFKKRNVDVKVSLVQRGDQILPNASDFNKESSMRRLKDSNIDLTTETSVVNVTELSSVVDVHHPASCAVCLSTKSGEEKIITTDLLLWTAGANPPKKGILNSILPRDEVGRILTSSTLQVVGLSNVFALGDCAKIVAPVTSSSDSTIASSYPATAQVAIQQSAVVAWNVFEVLKTTNEDATCLLPFRYLELGEMMTLGTDDATISSLGGLFQTSGKGASALRRFIYAVRMPTNTQRVRALVDSASGIAANAILAKKRQRRPDAVAIAVKP